MRPPILVRAHRSTDLATVTPDDRLPTAVAEVRQQHGRRNDWTAE